MNLELVWFSLPFAAILRMAGGTWQKLIDKIGFPVLAFLTTILFLGWSWWWLLLLLAFFAVCTLPFTLIGKGVDESPINWVWVWILGYLQGLPALVVAIKTHQVGMCFFLCLIPWLFDGIVGTFSNLNASRNLFPWMKCEFIMGYARIVPLAMLIQLAGQ